MVSPYACKVCLSSCWFEVPNLARQVCVHEVVTRWRCWLDCSAAGVSDTAPTATHRGEVRGTQQSGKRSRPAASSSEARPLPPGQQGCPGRADEEREGRGSVYWARAKVSSLL